MAPPWMQLRPFGTDAQEEQSEARWTRLLFRRSLRFSLCGLFLIVSLHGHAGALSARRATVRPQRTHRGITITPNQSIVMANVWRQHETLRPAWVCCGVRIFGDFEYEPLSLRKSASFGHNRAPGRRERQRGAANRRPEPRVSSDQAEVAAPGQPAPGRPVTCEFTECTAHGSFAAFSVFERSPPLEFAGPEVRRVVVD